MDIYWVVTFINTWRTWKHFGDTAETLVQLLLVVLQITMLKKDAVAKHVHSEMHQKALGLNSTPDQFVLNSKQSNNLSITYLFQTTGKGDSQTILWLCY